VCVRKSLCVRERVCVCETKILCVCERVCVCEREFVCVREILLFFGTHLSVGGCQLPKERLLYSSDISRSQFKVRVNKLDRTS
jgi:hypothetical protein